MSKYNLSPAQIEQIQKTIEKVDRIELIPSKDGKIKITAIQRKEVKT